MVAYAQSFIARSDSPMGRHPVGRKPSGVPRTATPGALARPSNLSQAEPRPFCRPRRACAVCACKALMGSLLERERIELLPGPTPGDEPRVFRVIPSHAMH